MRPSRILVAALVASAAAVPARAEEPLEGGDSEHALAKADPTKVASDRAAEIREVRGALAAEVEPGALEARRIWYGDWVLLNDGLSVLTMPVGVGVGGWFFANPILHWRHHKVGTGYASLAMRAVLPIGTAVATAWMVCGGEIGRCGQTQWVGLGVGLAGGVLATSLIDAYLLAYDDTPRLHPRRVRPLIVPDATGGVLGLTGTF